MKQACILFPHQLFATSPLPIRESEVFLVEETLFFNQYKFHKQKLAFHRASMRAFAQELQGQGIEVNYVEAKEDRSDVRVLIKSLSEKALKNFTSSTQRMIGCPNGSSEVVLKMVLN